MKHGDQRHYTGLCGQQIQRCACIWNSTNAAIAAILDIGLVNFSAINCVCIDPRIICAEGNRWTTQSD